MITKEIALTQPRELWHTTLRNADGTPLRCRSNGKCKIWVTRPSNWQLPVKHGLRQCFYITHNTAAEWELPHA
jgi:hypothetical protein